TMVPFETKGQPRLGTPPPRSPERLLCRSKTTRAVASPRTTTDDRTRTKHLGLAFRSRSHKYHNVLGLGVYQGCSRETSVDPSGPTIHDIDTDARKPRAVRRGDRLRLKVALRHPTPRARPRTPPKRSHSSGARHPRDPNLKALVPEGRLQNPL